METYKLMYFDGYGLGEPARWLFALAGQPYEDYRFQEGEWPSVKPNTPCGQAPILVVDGKQFSQTKAILRYLAKQFGFFAASDWDQARGDMVADYLDDIRKPLPEIYLEKDEAKKKELLDNYMENFPKSLKNLEKILTENQGGDGYFAGDKITWTDVYFVCNINIFTRMLPKTLLEPFPKLKALMERVESLPAIADWIKRRPVTKA
ncbi:hypothetical protein CAPTEDRAFT_177148 [Capitella teleta]|uniref:glutathione transferase n=1 Tax=Capitella teleta TaxID=283909 RepID=R7UQT3_CAPTE|nr:hypothetical protein CAPTEDRAFT_177148 [Capitella teleta]|eukprot:ELU08530.1 hypothetical protein CAPTEDRAFT_177148 [Capitella teleta]